MSHFKLVGRCRGIGDPRIDGLVAFLSRLQGTLGLGDLTSSEGRSRVTVPDREWADALVARAARKSPTPSVGVDFDVHGATAAGQHVRIEVHTGTHPSEAFLDTYNVDFGAGGICPSASLFVELVTTFRPFEAYVAELNNEHQMGAYRRQKTVVDYSRPATIRWMHFFGERMVTELGGRDRCLRAPAAETRDCEDGVFIRLTTDAFDPLNADHLRAQKAAMEYFGMML